MHLITTCQKLFQLAVNRHDVPNTCMFGLGTFTFAHIKRPIHIRLVSGDLIFMEHSLKNINDQLYCIFLCLTWNNGGGKNTIHLPEEGNTS